MRRIGVKLRLALLTVGLLLLTGAVTGTGAGTEARIAVMLDGDPLLLERAPMIDRGRTLIPMRGVFEALGMTVDYKDGTITAAKTGMTLTLTIGSRTAIVDGDRYVLDAPPVIVDSLTLVPLRFVAEAGGADVRWDAAKRRVVITTKQEEPGKAKPRPKIVLIGDSNTAIAYFKDVPELRWSSIIAQKLPADVINMGRDGRTTEYFLEAKKLKELLAHNADYYIIALGLNDVKEISASQFEKDQRRLVQEIQDHTDGEPILMTNVHVDYPDHYSTDRNAKEIKPFDDRKRRIAEDEGLHLIDVYERFKRENEQGNWDTRIRTTEIWDDSEDKGKTARSKWFNNIHYNVEGNRVVADEVVDYFRAHGLD
jgi:lysophospholipase L1-like esterase